MDAYLGQIILFAGGVVPGGWLECDGRSLSVADHEELFSLIGSVYGGDGIRSFCLPDFRGRIPVGTGIGPGLAERKLGAAGGLEDVTLEVDEMPGHTHQAYATSGKGTREGPSGSEMLGATPPDTIFYFDPPASNPPAPVAMGRGTVSPNSGGRPHSNLMPYTALRYLICMRGTYPVRE